MDQILAKGKPPTGLFISSDTVAIGVLRAAREHGLRIPEDLAIVGFDDIPMAVSVNPPLTTIRLPVYGIGWAAADLLISMITNGQNRDTNILLDTELIIHGSCGAKTRSSEQN